ncbi:MAG: hypothetical protein HYS13_04140 [Planctomycetia bacterium]|nr:hypothetical protein [Planctomycetia bacterium]
MDDRLSDEAFVRERLRWDLILQREFPAQHVAYVDRWVVGRKGLRLERKVVASATSLAEFDALVDKWRAANPDPAAKVRCDFIPPPGTLLLSPAVLSGRDD